MYFAFEGFSEYSFATFCIFVTKKTQQCSSKLLKQLSLNTKNQQCKGKSLVQKVFLTLIMYITSDVMKYIYIVV